LLLFEFKNRKDSPAGAIIFNLIYCFLFLKVI
jgi:hypothetical protein